MAVDSLKGTGVKTVDSGTHNDTGISYSIVANNACCTCSFIRESTGTAGSGWVNLTTIPQGYRPLTDVYGYFEHGNGTTLRARANANGAFAVYAPPTGQLGGFITYPI